jgi:type I restriction-modification system DNA methylase subunit
MFGKDDPWCKPAFGKKMLEALSKRDHAHKPVSRYIELENVMGHCLNHEARQSVGKVVSAWVRASDCQKENLKLVDESNHVIREEWAEIVMQEKDAKDIPLSLVDRLATKFI